MKEYLKTAIKLTKNIGTTGAISEFSRFVEKEITQNVTPDSPQIIVEFGGGHGNMTRAILARMHADSQLFTFELHDDFIPILNEIEDSRLHIIHDSAAEVLKYVEPQTVDCIVSTLPLTIIPKEIRRAIVGNAAVALKEHSVFSQALYTIRKDIINKHFKECSIEPMMNFPPAFVHHCNN